MTGKKISPKLMLTFVGFIAIGGLLILIVSLSGNRPEKAVEVPGAIEKYERHEEIREDPLGGLGSDVEEDQIKAAELVHSDPTACSTRLGEILALFKSSKFPKVRATLAKALGKYDIEKKKIQGFLEEALVRDKHYFVRLESAKSLRRICRGLDDRKLLKEAFSKALSDTEDEVCMEAMRFHFDNPDKSAIDELLSYVDRRNAKYKWKAIEVLGRIKDPSAGPPLLKILKDESQDIQTRCRACGVLGLLKYAPAKPIMQEIASNEDNTELGRVAKETIALFHK